MDFLSRNRGGAPFVDRIYLAHTLLCLLVVWAFAVFPTQDGPATLATVSLLHKLQAPECALAHELFRVNPYPIPNWMSHAALYLLTFQLSPENAEKTLISLYVLLFALGYRYFLRSYPQEKFMGGLLAAPLIMNGFLVYGFYNFLLSIAIMWWCLGYWLRHRKRRFTLLVMAIGYLTAYFSHAFGWAMMAVFQTVHLLYPALRATFTRSLKARALKTFAVHAFDMLLCILPSVLLFAGYLCIPKTETPGFAEASNGTAPFLYSILYKILSFFVGSSFSLYQGDLKPAAVTLGGALLFAYIAMIPSCRTVAERRLLMMCHGLVALIVVSPFSFGGGWHIQERLVFVFFLMLLSLLALRLGHFGPAARTTRCATGLMILLLLAQLIFVYRGAEQYQQVLGEFAKAAPFVQDSTLVASYQMPDADKSRLRAMGVRFMPRFGIENQSFERLFYAPGSCTVNLSSFQASVPYVFPVLLRDTSARSPILSRRGPGGNVPVPSVFLTHGSALPDTVLSWDGGFESLGDIGAGITKRYKLVYASTQGIIRVYRLSQP